MKTIRFTGKSSLIMLAWMAGLLSVGALNAQAQADQEKDPPTRVARISYLDGAVSIQPGGQGDWGSAAKNRPMTIGDKLWVDKDSRAELQTGPVSIHLGSMTALSFLNLDDGVTQMRLAEGSVNFRVREMRQGDLDEVDAPNMAFTVKQAGAFRIDVSEEGDSARVTVIRGEGEVTAGGKTYPVHAGERAEFRGIDNIEYNVERAPAPDGLDTWAQSREQKEDNSISGKYVSPDTPGYGDLDDYGTWSNEPNYGNVWYPNDVGPDWAPYSNGYWNSVGPWGWTWIGYEPWGFAPYHYGRWGLFGARWGWMPGPVFGPPIYGPAFVGFFGGGFGFGLGFGAGWFPLGFGEPFYPWFHCGRGFEERINVRNTFITNRSVFNGSARSFNYAYAHNVHAVTTASRETFTNGQAVNRGAQHITEASLRGAQVSNSAGLNPGQHSSLGAANANAHVAKPSAAVQNRSVMARTAPPRGASSSPVHTFNSGSLTSGRPANSNVGGATNRGVNNTAGQRGSSTASRTWSAQGNATDSGRAPAGFGSSNRSSNTPTQSARMNETNRPPWARSSASGAGANSSNGRTYNPPARSYNQPSRSYNAPSRSYSPSPNSSAAAPRTYSAPSRSYPSPSHSSPAPSHSSGGASHAGGGGHVGGGGGAHGGGGHH